MKIRNTVAVGSLLASAAIGAGLMYALDPARGVRRRAIGRDRVVHLSKVLRKAVRGRAKDIRNRTQGLLHLVARRFIADGVPRESKMADGAVRLESSMETDKLVGNRSQITSDEGRGAVQEATITSLIAICRQSADSYRRAAEILVSRPDLAHFFEEMADHRLLAADAIEKRLIRSGAKPVAAVLTAPPSEGWTSPTHETDPVAVIEICHQSEEQTQDAFQEALRTLPEEWRWELNEYCQHSRSALAKLHAWLQGKEGGAPPNKQRSGIRAANQRILSPDVAPSEEEQ